VTDELKYQIIEKALKASLKSKVIMYTNNSLDVVIRIQLITYNKKDFIFTLTRADLTNNQALDIVQDIILDYVSYITDFFVDTEAYEMVQKELSNL
jgi:hypothetical protein